MTGAGHNGMVAACCLTKAGRRVTVVEAYPSIGGMTATNTILPGAPLHRIIEGGRDVTLLRCWHISREPEPEKFGPAQIVLDPPYAYLQPDGLSQCVWRDPVRTTQEIKHFSPKGAKAYLEFVSSISLMMEFVLRFMRPKPTRINVLTMAIGAVKLLMHPMKLSGDDAVHFFN